MWSEELEPLVPEAAQPPPPHEVISYDGALQMLRVRRRARRQRRLLRRRRLPEGRIGQIQPQQTRLVRHGAATPGCPFTNPRLRQTERASTTARELLQRRIHDKSRVSGNDRWAALFGRRHFQPDAAVERDLDRVGVRGGEVREADVLEAALAAGMADAGEALAQRVGSAQEDVVDDSQGVGAAALVAGDGRAVGER